jgi:hypothetical protein
MDRRKFFQHSSYLFTGLTAFGIFGTSRKIFAKNLSRSFTISIVTDHPDKALTAIQTLLNKNKFRQQPIHYTEYMLHGKHISDIAYTNAGRLIDFRIEDQPLCVELRKIATGLELPRSCENPLLAHFSADIGIRKPSGIRISQNNEVIIERSFPVQTETIEISDEKGKVVLELSPNHNVRIIEASCKHKTCMKMGRISQAGQNLVCIPNRIDVTITGTDLSGVDSVTF